MTTLPMNKQTQHPHDEYRTSREELNERRHELTMEVPFLVEEGSIWGDLSPDTRNAQYQKLGQRQVFVYGVLTILSIVAFALGAYFLGISLLVLALAAIQIFVYAYNHEVGERLFESINPFVLPYTSVITLIVSGYLLILSLYRLYLNL